MTKYGINVSLRGSILKLLAGIIVVSALTACGGGGGGGAEGTKAGSSSGAVSNVVPVANAGADKTVNAGDRVELVASGTDSDGRIKGYQWTQLSGPRVSLNAINLDAAHFSFIAPSTGAEDSITLEFRLQVTDNDGATATDTVVFTVKRVNAAPQVNAGEDKTVVGLSEVSLIGSASDDSGEIKSYLWTQITGEAVVIDNANSATASFTAPSTNATITLEFKLTVTDRDGATAEDIVAVEVTSENAPAISFIFPPATGVYSKASISAFGVAVAKNDAVVETVEVSAGGASVMATVTEDGNWRADDIPVPAGVSEFTLTATVTDSEGRLQAASSTLLTSGLHIGSGDSWVKPKAVSVVPGADYVYVLTTGSYVRDVKIVPVNTRTGHRGGSITDFTNTALGDQTAVFQDMLFDEDNNRVLLASNPKDGVPQVVAVDVTTGVRTTISSDERGEGESFLNPVNLEWGPDRQLLVADNSAHIIFMVDPVSGDRTSIADKDTLDIGIEAPIFSSWVRSSDEIVVTPNVSPINSQYIFGIQDWQSSPFTYVISANGSQPGPQMRQVVQGSALDAENNRLLVLDGDNQLIAVDLEAGDRELLAEDVGGLSSLWDLAKNIEYDPTERLLYIADSTLRGGLYVVDPVSGSSVLLSN